MEGEGKGGNAVAVAVRIRPLTDNETSKGSVECCFASGEANVILGTGQDARQFAVDKVVPPHALQADVYDRCVAPLVDKFVQGYNATCFAYGQTGSVRVPPSQPHPYTKY